MTVARWERLADGSVVAHRVVMQINHGGRTRRYAVRRWRVERGAGTTHHIESLRVVRPSRSVSTLMVAEAQMGPTPGSIRLERLRWQTRPAAGPTGAPATTMTADNAEFDAPRWAVDGLYVVGLPVSVADYRGRRPGPVSGFLPPKAAWSRRTASLEVGYLIGPWRIAPQVEIAPRRWYGAGVGLATYSLADEVDPPALAPAGGLVDVQLRWANDPTRLGASALGDGVWGTPFTHVAASVDEVSHPQFWRTARLQRRAFFRPWRLSRVGVSLGGPDHQFRLRALHAQPFNVDTLAANQSLAGAQLDVAISEPIGDWADADIQGRHTSLFDGDQAGHTTVLRAGAHGVVGSPTSAFVRPALRGWLASGIGTKPAGLATRTTVQLAATVDAGVHLVGRFGSWAHHIEPGVVAAREIVGFGTNQMPTAAIDVPVRAIRQPQWTMAGATLVQRLELADSTTIAVPMALIYEGSGVDEAFAQKPWTTAAISLAHHDVSAQGSVLCAGVCDRVFWQANAQVDLDAATLFYSAGRLAPRLLAAMQWQGSRDDGWSLFEGFQALSAAPAQARPAEISPAAISPAAISPSAISQAAGIGVHHGPVSVDARGYWDAHGQSVGVAVEPSYGVAALGWRVGLRAAWRSNPGDWGIFVGLTSPP